MAGILVHSAFDTRVAWIRDLFERIEVDAQERRVVPVWRAPTDQDVDRLDSVTEWLRRAGAGRIHLSDGQSLSVASVNLGPRRTRQPAYAAVSCARCGLQDVHTRGPRQRYCPSCAAGCRRERVREAMRKARQKG
jgi:hypothetical protein